MGLNKRRGKLEIQTEWINSASADVLSTLFADFYPLWIDSGNECLEYHGLSEFFREIEDGADVPLYEVSMAFGEMCNYIEFKEVVEAE